MQLPVSRRRRVIVTNRTTMSSLSLLALYSLSQVQVFLSLQVAQATSQKERLDIKQSVQSFVDQAGSNRNSR